VIATRRAETSGAKKGGGPGQEVPDRTENQPRRTRFPKKPKETSWQPNHIDVPASGRRSTALVSMLADLSDFFVSHGLSGSAYEAVFDAALHAKDGVVADQSRAEELTPYRSLDPSRLKLSGTAQWSPLDYLDDDL